MLLISKQPTTHFSSLAGYYDDKSYIKIRLFSRVQARENRKRRVQLANPTIECSTKYHNVIIVAKHEVGAIIKWKSMRESFERLVAVTLHA